MKRYSLISSLAWMVAGVVFFVGSINIGLGTLREPGPGLFPFLMSGCLILFSLINSIFSLRIRRGGESGVIAREMFWLGRNTLKKLLIVIISLFLFVIAIDYIGFALTAFLFISLLLRFVEPQRWSTVFLMATLTTVISYAIFQLWLKADLPVGFWGF